ISQSAATINTNSGCANIEIICSSEAIAMEKGALAEAVEPQGTVILNADDPFSEGIAACTRAKVVFAGTTGGAVRAIEIRQSAEGSEFIIVEGANRCREQLHVGGSQVV